MLRGNVNALAEILQHHCSNASVYWHYSEQLQFDGSELTRYRQAQPGSVPGEYLCAPPPYSRYRWHKRSNVLVP